MPKQLNLVSWIVVFELICAPLLELNMIWAQTQSAGHKPAVRAPQNRETPKGKSATTPTADAPAGIITPAGQEYYNLHAAHMNKSLNALADSMKRPQSVREFLNKAQPLHSRASHYLWVQRLREFLDESMLPAQVIYKNGLPQQILVNDSVNKVSLRFDIVGTPEVLYKVNGVAFSEQDLKRDGGHQKFREVLKAASPRGTEIPPLPPRLIAIPNQDLIKMPKEFQIRYVTLIREAVIAADRVLYVHGPAYRKSSATDKSAHHKAQKPAPYASVTSELFTWLIGTQAFGDADYSRVPCVVGGNVSHYDSKGSICLKADFKCAKGTIKCNPAIFGKNAKDEDICVGTASGSVNDATSGCNIISPVDQFIQTLGATKSVGLKTANDAIVAAVNTCLPSGSTVTDLVTTKPDFRDVQATLGSADTPNLLEDQREACDILLTRLQAIRAAQGAEPVAPPPPPPPPVAVSEPNCTAVKSQVYTDTAIEVPQACVCAADCTQPGWSDGESPCFCFENKAQQCASGEEVEQFVSHKSGEKQFIDFECESESKAKEKSFWSKYGGLMLFGAAAAGITAFALTRGGDDDSAGAAVAAPPPTALPPIVVPTPDSIAVEIPSIGGNPAGCGSRGCRVRYVPVQ